MENKIKFDAEYALEQFREIQSEYFDESGKQYGGIYIGKFARERMYDVINKLDAYTIALNTALQALETALTEKHRAEVDELKAQIKRLNAKLDKEYKGYKFGPEDNSGN